MTDTTGQNEAQAQHAVNELIAGGITLHLVDTAVDFTDGSTEVNDKSVVSVAVAEADLSIVTPTDFSGVTELQTAAEIEIDVSGNNETVIEAVLQNDADPDRFVLADETNDPDLSENDTLTIGSGETLYETGNA